MIRGTVSGLDVTVKGISDLGVKAKLGAYRGVVEALAVAQQFSIKMISASDHSLDELAAMGHPYSAEHPAPPHSDPVIHTQSGEYQSALVVQKPVGYYGEVIRGSIYSSDTDKDRWLQEGTVKMIGRPWMQFLIDTIGDDLLAILRQNIQRGIEGDTALFGA